MQAAGVSELQWMIDPYAITTSDELRDFYGETSDRVATKKGSFLSGEVAEADLRVVMRRRCHRRLRSPDRPSR